MDRIEFVYWFATVICIGIFSLVSAVVIYSVIAFRAQPEDDTDGPPIHGHTGLEIAWTVVPFILVVAIGGRQRGRALARTARPARTP